MDGIAVLDGLLVAVGAEVIGGDTDAAAWTSSDDGSRWHRVDSPTSGLHDLGNQLMHRVVRGPEGLVAVGHVVTTESIDARVWKSGDGMDWTSLTTASFSGPGHEEMLDAAAMGAEVFAVGFVTTDAGDRDAAIWVESGGGWSMVDQDSLRGSGNQQINAVLRAGPGLVAVGTDDAGGDRTRRCGPRRTVGSGPGSLTWRTHSVDAERSGCHRYASSTRASSPRDTPRPPPATPTARSGSRRTARTGRDKVPSRRHPSGARGGSGSTASSCWGQKLIAVGSETRAFDDQGAVWIGKVKTG